MKFIYRVIRIISIIVISLLFIMSFISTAKVDFNEMTSYKFFNPIISIIIIVISIVVFKIFMIIDKKHKINHNMVLKVFLIIYFCINLFIIYIFNIYPRADQLQTADVAKNLIMKNLVDFKTGGYMFIYPHQLGLVNYFYIIFKIFGIHNYQIIQNLNNIYLIISAIYFYKIAKLTMKKNELSSLILLVLFIPLSFYVTFVYGNIISYMFSLISIYYLLKYIENKKIINFMVSLITIIISINTKNNALIFLIAELVLLFFTLIESKDKKLILIIIVLLCGYIGNSKIMNYEYKKISNINEKVGIPKIAWVAMGMQETGSGPGWWNAYNNTVYMKNNYNYNKATKESMKEINKSLKNFKNNPKYFMKFYYKKINSQWNNPTFESLWIVKSANVFNPNINVDKPRYVKKVLKEDNDNKILSSYMKVIHIVIIFGALLYLIFNKLKIDNSLLLIVFLGGFFFHILWEAKPQYTITYFVLLIPYCTVGYNCLIDYLDRRFKHEKKK